MAGRPKLNELCRRIENAGGDDYIFDRIADGESPGVIATSLDVSRAYIYAWINLRKEERTRRLAEARKLAAGSLADDGMQIIDNLKDRPLLTSADVSLATARANYRKWLASVHDREQFGESKGGGVVNISIGTLHLDALRAAGAVPIPIEAGEVIEAELLAEGDE